MATLGSILMRTPPNKHEALLNAARSAALQLGAHVSAAGHEPVADQCYRLLTAISAMAVFYRLRVTQDTHLTMGDQRQIISDTFQAVAPHDQFRLTLALDLLNQAMTVCLTADTGNEDDPSRLVGSLLAAASQVLVTLVVDLKDGMAVTSGHEETTLPGYRDMLLECRTAAARALSYVDRILGDEDPHLQ